jgi:hypothetical protein
MHKKGPISLRLSNFPGLYWGGMINLTLLTLTPPAGLRQWIFGQADFGGLLVSNLLIHITAVVVLVAGVVNIWHRIKRSPRIEDHYATKVELKSGLDGLRVAGDIRRNEIKEELAELALCFSTQLNAMDSTLGRELKEQNAMLMSIQRTLGRLEGNKVKN